MLPLYIAIFGLCLWGMSCRGRGIYSNYLSRETTNVIKGVFILMVFVAHLCAYLDMEPLSVSWDGMLFKAVRLTFGQLIVVMFLFYSSYGVAVSIASKGEDYVRAIPRRRVLTTFLNFDEAVVAFIVVTLMLGERYSVGHYALSLTGWENVGNSNWYIFVIMCCYLLSYVCERIAGNSGARKAWILCGLFVALLAVLVCTRGKWWSDTLLAYPAGSLMAIYKKRVEAFITGHYWMVLIGLFMVYAAARLTVILQLDRMNVVDNVCAFAFAMLVVTMCMKAKINNAVLAWCGAHLFPLYIYQRLPMIVISHEWPQWTQRTRCCLPLSAVQSPR